MKEQLLHSRKELLKNQALVEGFNNPEHLKHFHLLHTQIVSGLKVSASETDLDRIFYIDIATRLYLFQACCLQMA